MSDVFDLDAAYAEQAGEPFRFRWRGVEWEFPPLADSDWRILSLADKLNNIQGSDTLDTEAVAALEKLFRLAVPEERAEEWEKTRQPISAMITLFGRWMQHSGQRPGETLGSDGSSTSTAEPSPLTSSATTESGSVKHSSGRARSGARRVNSST